MYRVRYTEMFEIVLVTTVPIHTRSPPELVT